MFGWLIALILSISGLFYLLNHSFPEVLADHQNYMNILQSFLILSIVFLSVWRRGISWKFVLKSAFMWVFMAIILVSGYSYRDDLQSYYTTVMSNLIPSMAVEKKDGSVMFRSGRGGHFQINAMVNEVQVNFLLDTGASKVAFSSADARRVGIDMTDLDYNVRISTANGVSLFAPVIVKKIQVGSIILEDVPAYVGKPGTLTGSLLGMSFLSRLSSYEVSGNTLTLRQ